MPSQPTGGGEKSYTTGAAMKARCFIKDLTAAGKVAAGVPAALLEMQMATCQVPQQRLAMALELAGYAIQSVPNEAHVLIQVDGANAAVLYRVHGEIFRSKGPLSHQELTLVVD